MTVTLNEEQTDRFSKGLYQNSNLAKAGDDDKRLQLDESKALHLEYPEAAMAGQEPTGPAARAEIKAILEKAENCRRQYIFEKIKVLD